jgi:sugar phosphate isomerase/epimerase
MLTRRAALAVPAAVLAARPAAAPRLCLNTSTVRLPEGQWGKPRPLAESISIARAAGYSAVEPWVSEVDAAVAGGDTLADLRNRFADAGLAVPDLIGFAEWVCDDAARRAKGLEQAKKDFDKAAALGCPHLAAPPVGATGGGSRRDDPTASPPVSPQAAADRYGVLLDLGRQRGVTPLVEVWGHSRSVSRLGEAWHVAAECGRAGGAVLPDVYHLYKGGSGFAGLGLLAPQAVGIIHLNDYPKIDRGTITDQDRVYPGDGVAPLAEVFAALNRIGYTGFLSLELFNRTYWQQDPLTVARTGLAKLKAAAG